jgi:hypothetical protein
MAELFKRVQAKLRPGYNVHTALIVAAVPLAAALVYIVVTKLSGLPGLRYNPAYFSEEYLSLYEVPSAVVTDLEAALRSNDSEAVAALQGLRRPRPMMTSPNMRLALLYEASETYLSYLYWDTRTYERLAVHVQLVNGRWVVAPEDAHFFLETGKWMATWLPPALIWWIVELAVLLVVMFYRATRRWRLQTYG